MIGQEVRRRREELGLTGAQLAARAGMAPSAVSQIETGKRTPSSASVIKLAEALGVEVGSLFPKAQAPLPLEQEAAPRGGLSFGEVQAFLEDRLGHAWIALPEDEWDNWWLGVSRDEAKSRLRQIRDEAALLAEEFMATYGKANRDPDLVPRGRPWGDVYPKIFARKLGVGFYAPGQTEGERDFKKRQLQGLARAEFYEQPEELTEKALRFSAEAG